MELIHNRNREYKGQWVYKGMPVQDYTQDQADRMVQCGQAYWRPVPGNEPAKWPKKDENSSWYTLSNGKRIQGEEKALDAQSEIENQTNSYE